jgi:membrane-associated phospholipid phosphatase
VRMPSSTSFPSGHSASASAFAVAVGDVLPALRLPLRVAASIVAFSRVYTGVHYPGDVLVGATVGILAGRLTSAVAPHFAPQRGCPALIAWSPRHSSAGLPQYALRDATGGTSWLIILGWPGLCATACDTLR